MSEEFFGKDDIMVIGLHCDRHFFVRHETILIPAAIKGDKVKLDELGRTSRMHEVPNNLCLINI
jgi:hypothetical protein